MEELIRYLASFRLDSPLYFAIGSACALAFLLSPLLRKKTGLHLDLTYWKTKAGFIENKRVWILPGLAALAAILMAAVLANPYTVTKRTVHIYGKPVMAVIDVSGSMEYKARRRASTGGMSPELDLSNFEKACNAFHEITSRNLEADIGLLLYSTENYIARYFAPKNELLKDSLENKEEISFMSMGTRTAEALAKARTFFSEHIKARDKAIVLISDLEGDLEAIMKTAEELERDLWAGIKIYVVIIEKDRKTGIDGSQRLSGIKELKMVSMYDKSGIDLIGAEIAAMESAPLREESAFVRKSLIPFLIPPILALIILCLILSETHFRRIP